MSVNLVLLKSGEELIADVKEIKSGNEVVGYFFDETVTNYPPYNLIQVNNTESRLEIALAGFKKEEVNVYTEYGKLFVEGKKKDKEDGSEYFHQGLAQRSFNRAWTLADDYEVRDVSLEDGLLTVKLCKVVPEHHTRKDYL